LHEIPELYLQRRLVLKLLAILADYISTASQTARWVPGSATGFEVASNIASIINAKLEIRIIQVSILGLSMKQTEIVRQDQKKKQPTDLKSIDSTSHETPCCI
jgi:hypothetical protein